jgi:gamma-glutamylcyclotransferase (GGCT)/AIG2-like uncharacterized protein YtfP
MLTVFVYGTLKPGESNYDRYCAGRAIAEIPAFARGNLYALPLGYPAMTLGVGKVWGVLLIFNDPGVLTSLDRLEDYEPDRTVEENEYQRQEISLYNPSGKPLGQAWAYLMMLDRVEALGGRFLASGCWRG